MSTNTLLKLYNEASAEEIKAGVNWYFEANQVSQDISGRFNIPIDTVAQVLATLSPGSRWERNKLDASAICEAFTKGLDISKVKVTTYGANKDKAVRILQGIDNLKPTAAKTFAFYKNIVDPWDEAHVTVDRHAAKAFKGKSKGGSEVVKKDYEKIKRAYIRAANSVNITPCAFQAIVWIVYKRKVNR